MKNTKSISMLLIFLFTGMLGHAQDWANTGHFKSENEKLGTPVAEETRIVFMGNSITESWSKFCPDFFAGRPYINRAINGQTTPQMLVRFRQDVVNLKPAVVVILAGTNDIAGNTGPSTLEMIADNIISMSELAKANHIQVVLSSVLPVFEYPWRPGLNPAEKIVTLNAMLKNYAAKNGIIFLDYHTPMADERKGLKNEYTYDGVHPNEAGYKLMAAIAEEAIKKALDQR
jgi:lysophospholipase L1-like esterase